MKQRTLIISFFLAITLCLSDIYRRKSNRNPAGIGDIPIIGGVLNTGELLIDSIYGGSKTVIGGLGKGTVLTIGGLALDAYVLTLPIDAEVKARIISRISNVVYAHKLTAFILGLKGQYADNQAGNVGFDHYIKTKYSRGELPGLEHGLFKFNPEVESDETNEDEGSGTLFSRKMIAQLLVVYDALYGDESMILNEELPEKYVPISGTKKDREMINRIQPIVVNLLKKVEAGMDPGDMKDMFKLAIKDAAPRRATIVNNKAEAVTITLIDFVRSMVLKNYRSFSLKRQRGDMLADWMLKQLDNNPKFLVSFLSYQNNGRRFGVQYVVDGLQGQLMESLVGDGQSKFLKVIEKEHKNVERYLPKRIKAKKVERVPQMDFLPYFRAGKINNDENYLPYFRKIYTDNPNSISRFGLSSTPTISVRNLPIAKTGARVAGPGGTQVPNFHFVDRMKDRAYYFFGNDAILLEELTATGPMKSMFERLNSFKTLNCNAQYDWYSHKTYDALVNLALGEKVRDFGEKLCYMELKRRSETEVHLRILRSKIAKEIRALLEINDFAIFTYYTKKALIEKDLAELAQLEQDGMPDYALIYNPWPDHFAHFDGPFSDEILSPTGELNRLDYWLGKVEETYTQAGILDQTMFSMAGDHGLTSVFYHINPEVNVLGGLKKDLGHQINVLKISSDEGEGPKLTNNLNPPSNKGYDVIIASTAGGNYMMDFFKDQKDNWSTQPVYQDLVKHNFIYGKRPIDVIHEIITRLEDTLDYLVVREAQSNPEKSEIRIIGPRNGKRVDERIIRVGNKVFYEAINGEHLLLKIDQLNPYLNFSEDDTREHQKLLSKCLKDANINDKKTWCNESQWAMLTRFTSKPDSVVQLSHIYDIDFAGTVNLFPRDGFGYNTSVPGRHAGEHFCEKDAFVGFWGVKIKGNERLQTTSNGSIAPTTYDYITGNGAKRGDQGWGYSSVLGKIIKK